MQIYEITQPRKKLNEARRNSAMNKSADVLNINKNNMNNKNNSQSVYHNEENSSLSKIINKMLLTSQKNLNDPKNIMKSTKNKNCPDLIVWTKSNCNYHP